MTETVTEAAWLAAAKAIKATVPVGYGMTELEAATYARAALEAALPLVVAGEREALIFLAGCTLNEMTVKNLPWEWSPKSGMGVAQRALGCATVDDLVALVCDQVDRWPAAIRADKGGE